MRRVLSPALSAVGLIGFTLLLLRFPAQSTQAARDGVTLCADLILPPANRRRGKPRDFAVRTGTRSLPLSLFCSLLPVH